MVGSQAQDYCRRGGKLQNAALLGKDQLQHNWRPGILDRWPLASTCTLLQREANTPLFA